MRWSERQLAMLREMGIRVWSRDRPGAQDPALRAGDALAVEEAPGPMRATAPIAPPPASATAPVARSGVSPPAPVGRPAELAAMPDVAARAPTPEPATALASAEWLIVGAAFDAAGSAGDPDAARDQERLLDNMLHAIRVTRKAIGRDGRACHLPIGEGQGVDLDDAIARVRPRCILALGRAAANPLLGLDEPLGRLRERVHERSGVPVVVTFALPYLLRHPADKAKAWADLCRAVNVLDSSGVNNP